MVQEEEKKDKEEYIFYSDFGRQLEVVQDFYSKKAVAHASFFVASIFGLFTILTFMDRIAGNLGGDNWYSARWAMVLLFFAYLSVLTLGEYSFMNFSTYSNLAQSALRKRARRADDSITDFTPRNMQEKATRLFMTLKSSMGSFNSFLIPFLFLLVARAL